MTVSTAFLAEAAELAESFATGVADLETSVAERDDPRRVEPTSDSETLRELFRLAHSLKGMSAMEGIVDLNHLAHACEDLLDRYRAGTRSPTAGDIDVLVVAADAMGDIVDTLSGDGPPPDHRSVLDQLRSLAGPGADDLVPGPSGGTGDDAPSAHSDRRLADLPAVGAVLRVTLAPGSDLPGARAAVLMRQVGRDATIVFTVPERDQITAGSTREFLIGVDLPAASDRDRALRELLTRVRAIRDIDDVVEHQPSDADGSGDGDDKGAREHTNPPPSDPRASGRAEDPRAARHDSSPTAAPTVRVEARRLDALLEVVGELVIERNRLDALVDGTDDVEVTQALADLRRTVADLERLVQRVRTVPIAPVFSRLGRLVRETARELGVPVSLIVEGEGTEVDRSVADEILQPLVHLLRNAIDHGIEPPERRVELGKPPQGSLLLRAEQQGNQVQFEVVDDGGGLDVERITAKAVARGLLDERDVATLDRAALLDLIFMPGFSTNDDVSLVSGRGVGLDVVRSAVNHFGGGVEVDSTADEGTTFRIRLPLSLVVVDALVVRVGSELWALPLNRLLETVAVRSGAIRRAPGPTGWAVAHRSGLLPVIDGGPSLAQGAAIEAPCPAVVIETVGRPYVLTVDELIGHDQMVVRPVPLATGLDHLAGVASIADGRLALVLDIAALVDHFAHGRTVDGNRRATATGIQEATPDAGGLDDLPDAPSAPWAVRATGGIDADPPPDLGPDVPDRAALDERRAGERTLFESGVRRTQPVLDHYIRSSSTVSDTTSRDVADVAAAVLAHAEVAPVAFTLGGDLRAVLVFAIVAETRLLEVMGAHPDQRDAAIDELANMLGSQFVAALADDHALSVTLSTPMRPERTADDVIYLLRGAAPRIDAPVVWHTSLLGGPEPIEVLLSVDPSIDGLDGH